MLRASLDHLPPAPTPPPTAPCAFLLIALPTFADNGLTYCGVTLSWSGPFLANSTVSIAPVEDVQAGGVNDICAMDEIACGLTCGTPATVTYGRVVGPQVV